MTPLLLWFLLAQGADIATTAVALHRGCVERFVWPSHPYAGLAIKGVAGVTVAVTLGHRETTASRVVLTVGAVSGTVGASLNARTLGACHGS